MRPPRDLQIAFPDAGAAFAGANSAVAQELLRRFRALPEERLEILRRSAEVARVCACDLYWVGGGVRDLWLGRSERDIDLVVDGDLASFAPRLAAAFGGELRSHPQFLTAEFFADGGFRIDLAQVRAESYASPAALPVVVPGTLGSDFARRDFTVNCLAIPFAPRFGDRLIDACGGLIDLEQRRLRTLHADSFRDDPTRILRGLEFAARLGFELAPETLRQAERAIADGTLGLLSPARLGEALRRALGRAAGAGRVLRQMRQLSLLAAIDADLARTTGEEPDVEEAQAAFAASTGRDLSSAFGLALLCLALALDDAPRRRLARRLGLPAAEESLVTTGPARIRAALAGLENGPAASAAHALLAGLADEELAVVAAHGPAAKEWVRREFAEFRPLRLRISGRDLLAAGTKAGPALGRALELTLAARLDGRIDASRELAFALQAVSGAVGAVGAAVAAGEGQP